MDKIHVSDKWIQHLGGKIKPELNETVLYLYVQLYHGGVQVCQPLTSKAINFSLSPTFFEYFEFKDVKLSNLPR
jgi:hypothetical protein